MASQSAFQIEEVIATGWQLFKRHWKFLLVTLGISFILGILKNILIPENSDFATFNQLGGRIVGALIYSILWVVYQTVYLKVLLKMVDGQPVSIGDLFRVDVRVVINFILSMIIITILVGIGLVVLVLPGLILAFIFSQSMYLLVDKKCGPVQALTESKRLISGSWLNVLLLGIVWLIVLVASAFTIVGLLITVPMAAIISTVAYRRMEQAANGNMSGPGAATVPVSPELPPTPPASPAPSPMMPPTTPTE